MVAINAINDGESTGQYKATGHTFTGFSFTTAMFTTKSIKIKYHENFSEYSIAAIIYIYKAEKLSVCLSDRLQCTHSIWIHAFFLPAAARIGAVFVSTETLIIGE